jgi:hypothetical protein
MGEFSGLSRVIRISRVSVRALKTPRCIFGQARRFVAYNDDNDANTDGGDNSDDENGGDNNDDGDNSNNENGNNNDDDVDLRPGEKARPCSCSPPGCMCVCVYACVVVCVCVCACVLVCVCVCLVRQGDSAGQIGKAMVPPAGQIPAIREAACVGMVMYGIGIVMCGNIWCCHGNLWCWIDGRSHGRASWPDPSQPGDCLCRNKTMCFANNFNFVLTFYCPKRLNILCWHAIGMVMYGVSVCEHGFSSVVRSCGL